MGCNNSDTPTNRKKQQLAIKKTYRSNKNQSIIHACCQHLSFPTINVYPITIYIIPNNPTHLMTMSADRATTKTSPERKHRHKLWCWRWWKLKFIWLLWLNVDVTCKWCRIIRGPHPNALGNDVWYHVFWSILQFLSITHIANFSLSFFLL